MEKSQTGSGRKLGIQSPRQVTAMIFDVHCIKPVLCYNKLYIPFINLIRVSYISAFCNLSIWYVDIFIFRMLMFSARYIYLDIIYMVEILDNILSRGGQGSGQQRAQVVWPHEGHWLPVLGSLHPGIVTSVVTSVVTSSVVTVVIIRVVSRLPSQQPCIELWKCASGLQMQFPWDEKSILRIELDKICKYWQAENVNGQSKVRMLPWKIKLLE